jgi:hypothetical protein
MKLLVIKVAKCKHSSILTSIQNTKYHYTCTNYQNATEAKDKSDNWSMSKLFEKLEHNTKNKTLLKNKNKGISEA